MDDLAEKRRAFGAPQETHSAWKLAATAAKALLRWGEPKTPTEGAEKLKATGSILNAEEISQIPILGFLSASPTVLFHVRQCLSGFSIFVFRVLRNQSVRLHRSEKRNDISDALFRGNFEFSLQSVA